MGGVTRVPEYTHSIPTMPLGASLKKRVRELLPPKLRAVVKVDKLPHSLFQDGMPLLVAMRHISPAPKLSEQDLHSQPRRIL